MSVFSCRNITFRAKGILYSRLPIGEVLQKKCSPRVLRMNSVQKRIVESDKYVVFHKGLLGEPINERLAEDLACFVDIGKVKLCDPKAMQIIKDFKKRPVIMAGSYGMQDIASKLLSKDLSADLRFKGYEVFNHAIGLDKRNGTNAYCNILMISSIFRSDFQKYEAFIDRIWLDPKYDENEYRKWLYCSFVTGIGENTGFESTGYYDDERFLCILNAFLDANNLTRVKKVKEPVIEKHNIF